MLDLSSIRSTFRISKPTSYFNTAAFGLVPEPVLQASEQYKQLINGQDFHPEEANEALERLRYRAKEFLGAGQQVLSFIPGFTYGLQSVVAALRRKSRIIVPENEYPSLFFFWEKCGHSLFRYAVKESESFDYDRFFEQVKRENIDIIALSHINYRTGQKLDLGRLHTFCRENNRLLLVDATQAFGLWPYDISAFSNLIFMASSYKWPGAGHGTGILAFPRPLMDEMDMASETYACTMPDTQFELSHYNYEGIYRLDAALQYQQSIGLGHIWQQALSLTNYFYQQVTTSVREDLLFLPETERSGIVSIRASEARYRQLEKAGVKASYKDDVLRLSFHYYNTRSEIDQLVGILAELWA